MQSEHHAVPIWFFIGVLLLIYGVIILGNGLVNLGGPANKEIVLSHLHAELWWGGLLIVLGAWYTLKFRP